MTVNGEPVSRTVEPRLLLSDFIRDRLGLTGTHVGCEHGICGACTVVVDGEAVRSCTLFAVQVDGQSVTTVEGLSEPGTMSRMQEAFRASHGLQCGFCTPGFLMTLHAEDPADWPGEEGVRRVISGNLCRCTGYQSITKAVESAWTGDDS
jgi:aerobic-type carbon monoxide dehydrogenase small subunit (CoxS/CutS family)